VGDETTLRFESFWFNEDAPAEVQTQDGTVSITAPPRLLGDVTDNGDVTAYDASWVLQHTVNLRVLAVGTAALTSDHLVAHNVEAGRIRASFAGAESGVGSGPVLELVFDASDEALLHSLRLDRVRLNEGMIPVRIAAEVPKAYRLAQNCPNPFNPETVIRYDLPEAGSVRLTVYALTGQVVRRLVDGDRSAGRYSVVWDGRDEDGRDVASGVYLYRMVAGEYRGARKLVLVR